MKAKKLRWLVIIGAGAMGLASLCCLALGWIPLNHALQPWRARGEYVIRDSAGAEHRISVLTKDPVEVPGDCPEIRLIVSTTDDRREFQRRLRWFRFPVGEVAVRGNILDVYHGHPWEECVGLRLQVADGNYLLTEVYWYPSAEKP
jgi:hypothetical protein